MKSVFALILSFFVISHASECVSNLSISHVESTAKSFVGSIESVKLAKDKRENICVYKVKGENGYVVVDASTGEVLKFYKKRSK
ncbi:MAG: PepSY domain-containing protein [Hydrogenothermaceae bacterium]|nr:PepSY domain-containing protein [Hydrogenothermaceae bacterium]